MTEYLPFTTPPTTLDQADGVQIHVLGVDVFAVNAGLCTGVRWWRPTTNPSIQCVMAIWRLSDQVLLASKNISPAVAGYSDFLFDAAVAMTANEHYVVGVKTNRYAFSVGGWTYQSTTLRAESGVNARLALNTGGALTFPSGIHAGGANFFVSPIFEPTTVSASAALSAESSLTVSARLTVFASASLSAQSGLSVSAVTGNNEPGILTPGGSAAAPAASGTTQTLTPSARP